MTVKAIATPKRLSQTQRVPTVKGYMTQRDNLIIQAVSEYRVLTSHQLARLFVPPDPGKPLVASNFSIRLRMLFHRSYLHRIEQPSRPSEGRKPFLYTLAAKGAKHLEDLYGERPLWNPSDRNASYPFLAHLLKTNDIRIWIATSAKRNGYTVETWIDDAELKSPHMKHTVTITTAAGNTSKTAIVPDGYFRLTVPHPTGERIFRSFIECDMGTTTIHAQELGRRDFRHKILAYTAYINSGMCTTRYGAKAVKILTITTSEDRLQALKKMTEAAGGKRRFWFTTFDRITNKDILTDYVWSVASDAALFSFTESPPKNAHLNSQRV